MTRYAAKSANSAPAKSEAISLAEDLAGFLKERLSQKLVSVVLLGSTVRKESRRGSDIDILIVLDISKGCRRKELDKFWEAVLDFEDTSAGDFSIHYIPLAKEEAEETYSFYLDMVENSVILLDTSGFIKKKLKSLGESMRKLGTRKEKLPRGKWYCELKPGMESGEEVVL